MRGYLDCLEVHLGFGKPRLGELASISNTTSAILVACIVISDFFVKFALLIQFVLDSLVSYHYIGSLETFYLNIISFDQTSQKFST